MLSTEQLEKFRRNGFVLGSRVVNTDELETLCSEVLRVVDDAQNKIERERKPVGVSNMGKPEAPVWQIVNIWEGSEAFERVVNNSILAEEVAQLLPGKEVRLFHDQIQFKPATTGGVNMWHQDSPYWPVLWPKDVQLTAWVALDDADVDNGCMSMVKGSHLWGDQIDELHKIKSWDGMPSQWKGNNVEIAPCPVPAGHVHFHHPLTWHGSPANTSGRPRRALALHFMSEEAKFVGAKRALHPMGKFVETQDGETVRGAHFPMVWPRPQNI
ncbi:phytanoyl-CoA dioxygenase family protein [bacterium]|nr:MAG: phytanoyl-CoA dioxygenase family protein [bacterium]